MPALFSRRNIIMRFGARVARLLNSDEGVTKLDDGRLYVDLQEILGGERGPQSKVYSRHLAGHALVEHRLSPEEAAQVYTTMVMERPLYLARGNSWHKGHELFVALCRRGVGAGWETATLVRVREDSALRALRVPDGFDAVRARLARFPTELSKGNPAKKTRVSLGPLYLDCASARIELPEELSLWAAITAAPRRLVRLEGRDWVSFRHLVIRAFEAANTPFAALLSIGLWPPDWEEELSTHQVKQLSAFLAAVRREGGHRLFAWQRVWDAGRKVAKYESAGALWNSELGKALQAPHLRTVTLDLDLVDTGTGRDSETDKPDERTFAKHLSLCLEGGAIDDLERKLYLQLYEGENAATLEKTEAMQKRLREGQLTMAAYMEDLSARVYAYVRSITEIHPDEEEDENGDPL
jgi:hypothetical protein